VKLGPQHGISTQPASAHERFRATCSLPLLAVFSASARKQPKQASPERVGEYRQT